MTAALDGSIRELVDRRAADAPDAVFLIDPDTGHGISFAELAGRCRAVAGRSRAFGWILAAA